MLVQLVACGAFRCEIERLGPGFTIVLGEVVGERLLRDLERV
jgi:hypothetical protein